MADYRTDPASIRPASTLPASAHTDPTRTPVDSTTAVKSNGMSGTTMALIAVAVLFAIGAIVWSYGGSFTQTTTDPVAGSAPVIDDAPLQTAPALGDTVAPLDAAPVGDAVVPDAERLIIVPADEPLAPGDATIQP